MPSFLRWVVGGLIGGAVGAAAWAAITYYTNHEIGYVAWGVGILVGFCVRFAAGSDEGFGPGLTAAAIAIVALVGGKYAATSLLVDKVFADMPMIANVTPAQMQEELISEIVAEWTEAKKPMKWPAGKTLENAESTADYPPEVVKEAEKRWNALKPEEQQAQIQERTESIQAFASSLKAMARQEGFKASFTPIDILFFILAIGSAWKLGSGVASGE